MAVDSIAYHSERKIDQIESRLGSIESLLRTLSTGTLSGKSSPGEAARPQSHTPGTGSSGIPTAASTVDFDSSDDDSAFGGDSGFTSQTAFASEFLEHAVKRTSLRDANPGMETALTNLRQLVEVQKHQSISHGPRFPFQKPIPWGGLGKLPMPPMEVVISLLKQYKSELLPSDEHFISRQAPTDGYPVDSPPSLFSFANALVGITDFSGLCRTVYFPTEDVSQATFGIVNGGLYNLFMEEMSLCPDRAKRDEYQGYADLAQANLETYLANLPLFMSSKVENVQALLLGVSHLISIPIRRNFFAHLT